MTNHNVMRAIDEPHAPVTFRLSVASDLHAAGRSLPGHGEVRSHLLCAGSVKGGAPAGSDAPGVAREFGCHARSGYDTNSLNRSSRFICTGSTLKIHQ